MISLVVLYILTHHILCGNCLNEMRCLIYTNFALKINTFMQWYSENRLYPIIRYYQVQKCKFYLMTFYIQLGNILLIFRNVLKRNTLRVTFWLNLSSFIFFVYTSACHKLAVSLLNVGCAAKRCLWQGPVMSLITNIAFDKYILWHEFMSLAG